VSAIAYTGADTARHHPYESSSAFLALGCTADVAFMELLIAEVSRNQSIRHLHWWLIVFFPAVSGHDTCCA